VYRIRTSRTAQRAVAAGVLSAFGVAAGALLAGPASAHVTVNPREATQGGYEKLVFRVPNERDDASTIKVVVRLPLDTPLTSVRVKPHAGWDAKIERQKLPTPIESGDTTIDEAPATITWTAQPGTKIGPDQFDEFEVSAGRLPEVDSMVFPAEQTYDSGEVVDWAEVAEEGAEEPELPAPVLALKPAEAEPEEAPTNAPVAASSEASTASSESDGTARALGAGGLVVGVLGLGAGATAMARARRQPSA
jgi:uncharacterized protein YcnI